MNIFKNILSKNFILPFRKDVRFIFIYHDVSDKSSLQYSEKYSTTINNFKEQVSFLSNHFRWVNLNEIHNPKPFKNNVAAIVFDDGFKSVAENALPYLNSKNIPFAVFVNKCAVKYNRLWVSDLEFNKKQFGDFVSTMDKFHFEFSEYETNHQFMNNLNLSHLNEYTDEQIYLNEADIFKLHQQGVIIGNHGSMHANLNLCDQQSLQTEIIDNKLFIEKIIKAKVNHYAIAFGKNQHYNRNAIREIRESGHQYIYSSNPVKFSSEYNEDLIPRVGLTENSNEEIMFYINRQFLKNINL
jgi:peptidoglycan/xylan/chitin deacetylase (PgdA/CDA1 family)